MKYYDISMEITEDMAVYEGNPTPQLQQYAIRPKDVTNETKITIGSHTGSHVDATRHVDNQGETIKEMDLDRFCGEAKLFDLSNKEKVEKEDLEKKDIEKDDILLFKTNNSKKQYNTFRKDYAYITRKAAEYLVKKDVKAVGIDYLSVKQYGKDDDVHEKLIKNMTVYEGLMLKDVPEGEYEFFGFPLKINVDGGPCRAVLRK